MLQNPILVKQTLGFSVEEYFIEIGSKLKKEQENFLQEYENIFYETNQSSQEEIKDVFNKFY